MPRPTKEQMIKNLVHTVPEDGISSNSLRASFPTWQDTTFQSILELAIEQERVSRGPGGGGGVICRPSAGEGLDEDEFERAFLDAIEELVAGDYSTPVKSGDLRKHLDWDDGLFKRIRKNLQLQDTISVNRGPYAKIYLTSSADTDSRDDAVASASGPRGRQDPPAAGAATAEAPKQALLPIEEIEDYKEKLLHEIERLVGRHGQPLHISSAMNAFSRSRYAFWQCMAQLADAGKIQFFPDESSTLVLCRDNLDCLDDEHIFEQQFSAKLESQIKILSRLLAISRYRESIPVEELAEKAGMSLDVAICSCTRLLRSHLIIPLKGGLVKLDDSLSTDEVDAGADGQKLAVLREFKGRQVLGLSRLMNRLGGEQQGRKYVESCGDLLEIDEDAEVAYVTEAGKALLERNSDSDPKFGVICHSPDALAEFTSKLSQGKVTVFVGAGIPAAVGLPGWRKLLTDLVENSTEFSKDQQKEIQSLMSRGDYVGAASALEHVLGYKFAERVTKRLHLRGHEQAANTACLVVLAVLRRHFNGIFTTNIDKLLELAQGRSASSAWARRRSTYLGFYPPAVQQEVVFRALPECAEVRIRRRPYPSFHGLRHA